MPFYEVQVILKYAKEDLSKKDRPRGFGKTPLVKSESVLLRKFLPFSPQGDARIPSEIWRTSPWTM